MRNAAEERKRFEDNLEIYDLASLLRFSFVLKAVNWGIALGGLATVHAYRRHRRVPPAASLGAKVFLLSFFGIYLIYFSKRLLVSMSMANYERESGEMVQRERMVREMLLKRFKVQSKDADDDKLAAMLQKDVRSSQKYELVDVLVKDKNFGF